MAKRLITTTLPWLTSQKSYEYKEPFLGRNIGSGALSGKMLSGRIVENDKIDAYFRA